jgi:hypothetical protein
MKTYKGQVTVNPRLVGYLSDRLDTLSSPRERADFIAQAADRYCMLEKLGLIGINIDPSEIRRDRSAGEVPERRDHATSEDLGPEFFNNVLSEYMSPPAAKSDNEKDGNSSPSEGTM